MLLVAVVVSIATPAGMAGEGRRRVVGEEGPVDWVGKALSSVPGHVLQCDLSAVVVEKKVVLPEVDVEGDVV